MAGRQIRCQGPISALEVCGYMWIQYEMSSPILLESLSVCNIDPESWDQLNRPDDLTKYVANQKNHFGAKVLKPVSMSP